MFAPCPSTKAWKEETILSERSILSYHIQKPYLIPYRNIKCRMFRKKYLQTLRLAKIFKIGHNRNYQRKNITSNKLNAYTLVRAHFHTGHLDNLRVCPSPFRQVSLISPSLPVLSSWHKLKQGDTWVLPRVQGIQFKS